MGFFSSAKKLEGAEAEASANASQPPASLTRVSGSPPATAAAAPRFGIDHTIQLMRTLPTEKNVDLVITVLKTTLESLNIRVVDIVQDATKRQQDIEARVAGLKGEIAALENEMDQRLKEIMRLESAHSETSKVKDYLTNSARVPGETGERPTVVNNKADDDAVDVDPTT